MSKLFMFTAPLPLRTPDSLCIFFPPSVFKGSCLPTTNPSNLFSQEVQMTTKRAKGGKGPEMQE